MEPLGLLVRPPVVENWLGLGEGGKPILREALAPERAIEGLDQAVVPGFAGATEVELDLILVGPGIEGARSELRRLDDIRRSRGCGTLGSPLARAIRAYPVAELDVAVPPHVGLELLPAALVGKHPLAARADLDQAA